MVWVMIALLALAAVAPLSIALERRAGVRGARAPALALHRGQLAELDRDLSEGKLLPAEHATAVLEVQRRLLAAAEAPEPGTRIGSRLPVIAAAVLIPLGALGLYLVAGQPGMPSVTPGSGEARQQRAMEEAALIAQLRERLQTLDPATDQARQGWVLLGNVEESRGNDAAAVQAWRTALSSKFDATLAVRPADAMSRVEGRLTPPAVALFRRALAAEPNAPWRGQVEERLRGQ